MVQYSYYTCPPEVRAQLAQLRESLHLYLLENLVGIYLHGSLATGSFNPLRSDLDILVVIRRATSATARRRLAGRMIALSRAPIPVEISILRLDDFYPWQYPTPFDFHYSEAWREAFNQGLKDPTWRPDNMTTFDTDLAAHIVVAKARGVALFGPPIAQVFPPIPQRDFLSSVLEDVFSPQYGLEAAAQSPINVLLNACRTQAYLQTGALLSKAEGGDWALATVPDSLRPIVQTVIEAYREDAGNERVNPDDAQRLSNYFACAIRDSLREKANLDILV